MTGQLKGVSHIAAPNVQIVYGTDQLSWHVLHAFPFTLWDSHLPLGLRRHEQVGPIAEPGHGCEMKPCLHRLPACQVESLAQIRSLVTQQHPEALRSSGPLPASQVPGQLEHIMHRIFGSALKYAASFAKTAHYFGMRHGGLPESTRRRFSSAGPGCDMMISERRLRLW